MGKNLKHQFIHAIEDNFKESMDKHSMKANDIRNDGKVFSYADRKNLIDVASNFSNYMKENYKDIFFEYFNIRKIDINYFHNFHKENYYDACWSLLCW